jgi:hypothetical protein
MKINGFFLSIIIFFTVILISFCDTPSEVEDLNQKTLASFQKIDDHPLYQMTYYGDYGFDQYILQGMEGGNNQNSKDRWGCTCFTASNEAGEFIFGRNFDWYDHPAIILFTDPPNGYASISMVDISYLGFDNDYPTEEEKQNLLTAPYLPFDGMNEKGFAVGMMAVPSSQIYYDPDKVTLSSLEIIRLLLDYSQNIDEAIDLVKQFNINFEGGPYVHYLISDAAGNSAIIEYVDNKILTIRNTQNWQVSTNFLMSKTEFTGAFSPCWRYNNAYSTLEDASGILSNEGALNILSNVSQSNTQWSVLYNQTNGKVNLVMGRNYGNSYTFELGK